MRRRADDTAMAKIFRQTRALAEMAEQGKRDPEWVSSILQGAIEHLEDGRVDFIADTKVIPLGEFEVDYETPTEKLAGGLPRVFNPPFEIFDIQPSPDHYEGGLCKVTLCLVHYSFNKSSPMYDEVRSLLARDGFLPVQIRELVTVFKNQPDEISTLADHRCKVLALGYGVPSSGTLGNTPCMFELVPVVERFHLSDPWKLATEHVTHSWSSEDDYFLVRKIVSRTY